MLVAAAKINQSSIVPAFDQTRVPRIIQAKHYPNSRIYTTHPATAIWTEKEMTALTAAPDVEEMSEEGSSQINLGR
jgi:hypothetical protein